MMTIYRKNIRETGRETLAIAKARRQQSYAEAERGQTWSTLHSAAQQSCISAIATTRLRPLPKPPFSLNRQAPHV